MLGGEDDRLRGVMDVLFGPKDSFRDIISCYGGTMWLKRVDEYSIKYDLILPSPCRYLPYLSNNDQIW